MPRKTMTDAHAPVESVPIPLLARRGKAPTEGEVRAELTSFWDAFSPLNLAAIQFMYDKGKSLDDIGITELQAETFVNKYNSVVTRAPGVGPLVRSSEAKKWHSEPMKAIVNEVSTRAQP